MCNRVWAVMNVMACSKPLANKYQIMIQYFHEPVFDNRLVELMKLREQFRTNRLHLSIVNILETIFASSSNFA